MSSKKKILVRKDLDELSLAAAELFAEVARRAIVHRGMFSVALSGGSTPTSLYKRLAAPPFRDDVDWSKVAFFFGDERNVPPDSPDSNFRMARDTLLGHIPVAPDSVHAWPTQMGTPEEVAAVYARGLGNFFGGLPRFDMILLGLGSDAHTASLFPRTSALRETAKLAVANWVESVSAHRLTMTLPVFNGAANVIFLVSGDEKADAVAAVLEGEFRPHDIPAQLVQPDQGELFWLLDEAAASMLQDRQSLLFRRAET